ncbi:uncharacterized protein SPPG_07594 [Spizellomyces punctatus DAOM BR117]|uniref:Uncharacterized protein n=1 Tax=Spizellomyces punctatus (strain DAOM BR117) TaxID=645134 RepID=A0A0L0H7L1_SPIPD|nr:uncharacterized protein SPPG_07594 [Spizellomyces punctatus DAOM BR117]KNC97207.1 hypothetical protein SPPG_07594 [Spizellomyces punctatus DAOM BR117]|eukprot:XP_016605247.1 hypothetical protein SPPG_07594 [Spizellomyces punctatus DAOM BR117]
MATFPLHTANLAGFLNENSRSYATDLAKAQDYQRRGAFSSLGKIQDISFQKSLVKDRTATKTKNGEPTHNTYSTDLGLIACIIRNAGHDFCGLEKSKHDELTKPLYNAARDAKKAYKDLGDTGERPMDGTIEDWDAECAMMRAYNEEQNKIYDKPYPNKYEIYALQDAKIGLFTSHFYNVHANYGTLKNFKHPGVNWKKDNIFVYDNAGNACILWNDRKQDRISAAKTSAKKLNDTEDNDRYLNEPFLQSMTTPHFPEIAESVDPSYVAKELVRFVTRFRMESEYIFLNSKEEPFVIDTFRNCIQNAWSKATNNKDKNYGVRLLRSVQITHIRKRHLKRAASTFMSKQHHHNEAENLAYCKDAAT